MFPAHRVRAADLIVKPEYLPRNKVPATYLKADVKTPMRNNCFWRPPENSHTSFFMPILSRLCASHPQAVQAKSSMKVGLNMSQHLL